MKALQNPIVVTALVVMAAWMVYDRVVAPLLQKGKAVYEQVSNVEPLKATNGTQSTKSKTNASSTNYKSKLTLSDLTQKLQRDPFAAAVVEKVSPQKTELPPAASKLHVEAISVQGENRYAIINHRIVKENDVIDGYQIVKIEPNVVVVESDRGLERVFLSWFSSGSGESAGSSFPKTNKTSKKP